MESTEKQPDVARENVQVLQQTCLSETNDDYLFTQESSSIADRLVSLLSDKNYTNKEDEHLTKEIDILLLKLSEFVEIVDVIRCDTNLCVGTTLPAIAAKAQELENVFARIDQLEVFISMVLETLVKLEVQVSHAEQQTNSLNALKKKVFGAFSNIGKRHQDTSPQYKQNQSNQEPSSYEPVPIFSTATIFKKHTALCTEAEEEPVVKQSSQDTVSSQEKVEN